MARMNALTCVAQNDICSLRIVCTTARDLKQELEEKDNYGNTALLKACYMGRYDAVCTLIQFGADVRAVNHYGQNALSLAAYNGCKHIIIELLRYCSYDEYNKSTLMPALCVATMCQNWHLVAFLKEIDARHGQYSEDIQTAHGLNSEDLMNFLKLYYRTSPQHKTVHMRH